jgi:hypothetical protein
VSATAAVATVAFDSLAEVHEAARRAQAPLLWLIDSGATACEGALDALLRHEHEPAVSLPVDARGEVVEPLLGRYAVSDLPELLEAVNRGLAPLRHTRVVSMVVARDLVLDLAPPDLARFGPYAGSEWTARLFARRRGMLVPESRVRVAGRPATSVRHALRMAQTGAWWKGETLRELHRSLPLGR